MTILYLNSRYLEPSQDFLAEWITYLTGTPYPIFVPWVDSNLRWHFVHHISDAKLSIQH